MPEELSQRGAALHKQQFEESSKAVNQNNWRDPEQGATQNLHGNCPKSEGNRTDTEPYYALLEVQELDWQQYRFLQSRYLSLKIFLQSRHLCLVCEQPTQDHSPPEKKRQILQGIFQNSSCVSVELIPSLVLGKLSCWKDNLFYKKYDQNLDHLLFTNYLMTL